MNCDEKAWVHAQSHHTYENLNEPENLNGHLRFVDGARWQRDQMRSDEAVERAARAMHADDLENGFCAHEWGEHSETDEWYRRNARAAVNALVGDEQD